MTLSCYTALRVGPVGRGGGHPGGGRPRPAGGGGGCRLPLVGRHGLHLDGHFGFLGGRGGPPPVAGLPPAPGGAARLLVGPVCTFKLLPILYCCYWPVSRNPPPFSSH